MDAETVRAHLRELADPAIARQSQRFFKTGPGEYGEGDRFLGIRVPVLRKVAKRLAGLPVQEVLKLLRSPLHEERLLALFILIDRFRRGTPEEKEAVYRLYLQHTQFINNWDLVDTSAEHIVGAFLWEHDRKPLYELAKSQDLWERRIAIMATFYFIKQNDFGDALRISGLLLNDREDLIHKAVGWMLREIGKRAIEEEESFLRRHYRQMPRTMLRYAIEKFPEEKRQRYLRGQISPK